MMKKFGSGSATTSGMEKVRWNKSRAFQWGMLGVILLICVGTVGAVGETWTQATPNAGWKGRFDHAAVVFNNKMWVLGGSTGQTPYKNDVWYSDNGIAWTQATPNAGWSGRQGHQAVVFNNKMWVLGGLIDGSRMNDIWYSDNGITWTPLTPGTLWSARMSHAAVVFKNKMWVLGGNDGSFNNDTWYSENGVTWLAATLNAGWSWRQGHAAVVFDNRMWVLGGADVAGYKNDTWFSYDGITWTLANASSGWPARAFHEAVVFNNTMWVLGGQDGGTSYKNDVWYSTNGTIWTRATPGAGWTPRYSSPAVVFNNMMWVLGGNSLLPAAGGKNDTWSSQQVSPLPITLSIFPQQASVINGTTTNYAIILSAAPNGISGVKYQMYLNNSIVGKIVGFTPPPWAGLGTPQIDSDMVYLKSADLEGVSGNENITLGTFRVSNEKPGLTKITFYQHVIEDRLGNYIAHSMPLADFTVVTERKPFPRPQPLGGFFGPPTDPDHDYKYEDLDGNGAIRYNDVVLMFTYMDDIDAGSYGTISSYDFDSNGAIGSNDVVSLYTEIS